MMRTADIDRMATAAQQAALDNSLWPDVLVDLSQVTNAVGTVMFSIGSTLRIGPFSSPDLDEVNREYVKDGWFERDERLRALPTIIRSGAAVDQDFISTDEMKRSVYYQEFLAKHDLQWFATLGVWAQSDLWVMSIQRSFAQGAFAPDEIQRLAALGGPMSDAASLSRQVSHARILGVADGLELIGQPCALLDDRGCMLAMNPGGEALVASTVNTVHRTLHFGSRDSQSRFDKTLAEVLTGQSAVSLRPLVRVQTPSGRWLSVRMICLRGLARYSFTGARVMLLFAPLDAPRPPAAIWTRDWGLTEAESRLATLLCAGRSLAEAADLAGIAYETARSRLKSIYSKTGTHRQGELIAVLVNSQQPQDR